MRKVSGDYVLADGERLHVRRLIDATTVSELCGLVDRVEEIQAQASQGLKEGWPRRTASVGRRVVLGAFTGPDMRPEEMVGFLRAGAEVKGGDLSQKAKRAVDPLTFFVPFEAGVYNNIDFIGVESDHRFRGVGTALAYTAMKHLPSYRRTAIRLATDNQPMQDWAESIGFVSARHNLVDIVAAAGSDEVIGGASCYQTPRDTMDAVLTMQQLQPWLKRQPQVPATA